MTGVQTCALPIYLEAELATLAFDAPAEERERVRAEWLVRHEIDRKSVV